MNIAQALKQKNRLVGQIKDLRAKVLAYNMRHQDAGTNPVREVPAFDSKQLLTESIAEMEKLAHLKAAIIQASAPIAHKLSRMAELKGLLTWLKTVSTRSEHDYDYSSGERQIALKISTIPPVDHDQMMQDVQIGINRLQDEIDDFNATTQVSV